ncbi:MAG: phosphoribosylanthranilate isomerase [Nitrospirae bacterium]|nr:phosphoribosylanthranilate isomerase [Nitrospirota bacterium]
MLKIKICGITNTDDASAAIEYGADALGFVFYQKSPRYITPETAKTIISSLPPFIKTVGVFVDKEKKEVEKITAYTGLDLIQFHGSEPPEYCSTSRKVIKALRVKELSDLEPLKRYKTASAFLLDTYSSETIGGTGQIFNWEIAIEAKKFGRIILAGGLTPENIEEAVKLVQPYGVDVASGVEGSIKGRKDHKKLRLFIERARGASLKHYL